MDRGVADDGAGAMIRQPARFPLGGTGMAIGTSLLLIAVGAILAIAVNYEVTGVDIEAVGIILIAVGILGLGLSLLLLVGMAPFGNRGGAGDRGRDHF
jgi:hypothetical protein